jgi:drug/metabolite transporter (DMT)-like permease
LVQLGKATTGIILVLVSAISFGFMPVFARLAYAEGVGVDELLFLRFLFSFIIVGMILALSRRLTLPKRRQDLLMLIVLGAVVYFVQSTLYFNSLLYSPVPIVALLLYTYPVFVTIGASMLGWEKISKLLVGTFIIAIFGLLLVTNPFGNPIGIGVILALGSAIVYTIYILSGSQVLRRIDGDLAAFYVIGAGSASFGLAGEATKSVHLTWSMMGWFWLVMITVVCTVIAITTFFMGLSKIGPSKASLISLVEPVTSIFASLAIFGNSLTTLQWLGGLLILVATAITILHGYPASRTETATLT